MDGFSWGNPNSFEFTLFLFQWKNQHQKSLFMPDLWILKKAPRRFQSDLFFIRFQRTTFNIWCYLAKTKEECLLNLLCLFLAVNILKLYFSLVFHWNSFSTILILHFILKIMINLRQSYLASEPKVFLEPRYSGCAPSFHMSFFPSSVSRLLLLR